MKCPECGKIIDSSENVCLNCGYKLPFEQIVEIKQNERRENSKKMKLSNISQENNIIAKYLYYFGFVELMIGIIVSIGVGRANDSFLLFVCYCLICIAAALLTFGIAEIIQILHDIRYKLWKNK